MTLIPSDLIPFAIPEKDFPCVRRQTALDNKKMRVSSRKLQSISLLKFCQSPTASGDKK